MNFQQLIKEEWEKEFKNSPSDSFDNEEPFEFENSIFQIYNTMVEKICVKVWNEALEVAADNADADFYRPDGQTIECYVLKESILKYIL